MTLRLSLLPASPHRHATFRLSLLPALQRRHASLGLRLLPASKRRHATLRLCLLQAFPRRHATLGLRIRQPSSHIRNYCEKKMCMGQEFAIRIANIIDNPANSRSWFGNKFPNNYVSLRTIFCERGTLFLRRECTFPFSVWSLSADSWGETRCKQSEFRTYQPGRPCAKPSRSAAVHQSIFIDRSRDGITRTVAESTTREHSDQRPYEQNSTCKRIHEQQKKRISAAITDVEIRTQLRSD